MHGLCMAGLLGLFCFRVAAQLVAAAIELPYLPPFDAWHSGLLPYPVLVAAQLVIVALMVRATCGVLSGRTRPRVRRGRVLLGLAAAYFALMSVRLVLGRTVLAGSSWWEALLPSLFHLVLASFLGVLGHFHLRAPAGAPVRAGAGPAPEASRATGPSTAGRWVTALGCLVLGPLAAEGAVRYLLFGQDELARRLGAGLRDAALYADPHLEDAYWRLAARLDLDPRDGPAVFDPRLGWVSSRLGPAPYLRPELELEGRRPLLIFGASYAHNPATPGACLEDLLRASDLGRDYLAVDYAVGGYGIDQMLLLLRRTIDHYVEASPVVVVVAVADSDFERASLGFRLWPKPRLRLSGGQLVSEPLLSASCAEYLEQHGTGVRSYAWRGLLHSGAFLPLAWRDRLAGGPAKRRAQLELIEATLLAIRGELESRAVPYFVLLCHSPTYLVPGNGRSTLFTEGRPSPAGALIELFERHRIPFVDTEPYVRRSPLGLWDLYLARGDMRNHPTAAGNRLLFEALTDGLEHLGQLRPQGE